MRVVAPTTAATTASPVAMQLQWEQWQWVAVEAGTMAVRRPEWGQWEQQQE